MCFRGRSNFILCPCICRIQNYCYFMHCQEMSFPSSAYSNHVTWVSKKLYFLWKWLLSLLLLTNGFASHSGSAKKRLCHREPGACVLLLWCQNRLCSMEGKMPLCLHGQAGWAQAASDAATVHGNPFIQPMAAKPRPWVLTRFRCRGVTCSTAEPAHSWANPAYGVLFAVGTHQQGLQQSYWSPSGTTTHVKYPFLCLFGNGILIQNPFVQFLSFSSESYFLLN